MIQFFAPDIAHSLQLPQSDSQHCVRVLRMKEGDSLQVVDGKGNVYTCRIIDAHPKHTSVDIISCSAQTLSWPNYITIGVAPTKHLDRMEWMVEKLVEIGVNRIIPLKCRFSERKDIKTERLEKIAVSAMKQSLKATLPVIDEMMPIAEAIRQTSSPQRFIAWCSDDFERKLLAREYKQFVDTTILIGPEGDFADFEVREAIDCNFVPVSLGDNRLRTETAAIVACDTFQIINQMHNKY